ICSTHAPQQPQVGVLCTSTTGSAAAMAGLVPPASAAAAVFWPEAAAGATAAVAAAGLPWSDALHPAVAPSNANAAPSAIVLNRSIWSLLEIIGPRIRTRSGYR